MGALKTFLLCCAVWWCVATCRAEDFHPERTRLIDYYPRSNTPHNFLFRGNMPLINGKFAYSEILSSMSSVAHSFNLSLPKNFSLIDVSYLNLIEEKDLKVEEDFFKSNPHLGEFHNRVIIGTFIPPPQHEPDLIKDVVKEYVELSFDKLPGLMEYFHSLVTRTGPVVIYSHCEAGTDRTGEVSGAYYLKFLNMTLSDAISIDDHIQSRDMYDVSRNALQWYCFYLKFIEHFTQLKCLV